MSNGILEERLQIRADVLAHKVPKRVPVMPRFTLESSTGIAGISLIEAHYKPELRERSFRAVCDQFYSDSFATMDLRYPIVYQLLGAKNWVLSSSGVVQHPEIETMTPEDYDEFTAAPYKTMFEKFLPKVCSSLDTDAVSSAMNLAKAYKVHKDVVNMHYGIVGKLSAEYNYSPGMIAGQLIEAPFDFLADQLRGFKGITMDVRRIPDKIEKAVEAIMPIMVDLGTPRVMREGIIDFIPLHLAPYINLKTFERLYWPTLKSTIEQLDAKGIACCLYCEEDWTRFGEHLAELPASTVLWFEGGDFKKLKATAGKDHVIGGFYDPCITLARSKQECIDAAKELVDTCAPGGQYFFTFDKSVMDVNSIDVGKVQAVLEWVRDNAVY